MTVTLTTAGPTCSTSPAKSGRPRTSGVAGAPPACGESAAGAAAGAAVEDCGAQALIRVVIRTMPTNRGEATYLDIDESLQLCRGPPNGPWGLTTAGMIPRPARGHRDSGRTQFRRFQAAIASASRPSSRTGQFPNLRYGDRPRRATTVPRSTADRYAGARATSSPCGPMNADTPSLPARTR